jgi:hypothetical protein
MSLLRATALVGASVLFACSAEGTQTGGEGSTGPCKPSKGTEVDETTARDLGFAVDEELPLFGQTFEAPFHEGNVDCSSTLPASNDGIIQVRATLTGIIHEKLEPTFPDSPSSCPEAGQDQLFYRADIELKTDNGTLSTTVPATAYSRKVESTDDGSAALRFDTSVLPSAVSGSLGIHIDPSRPLDEAWATIGVVLGATTSGFVVFSVLYLDKMEPRAEHGDGIFWPYDSSGEDRKCDWLDPYSEQQNEAISIDDYNAIRGAAPKR